jgi:hypothetical protein
VVKRPNGSFHGVITMEENTKDIERILCKLAAEPTLRNIKTRTRWFHAVGTKKDARFATNGRSADA